LYSNYREKRTLIATGKEISIYDIAQFKRSIINGRKISNQHQNTDAFVRRIIP